ncbi:hypothetical protein R1flu_026844 [Riccia fluitans]|uniref:2Fe-2S ferredoxin-type domain-containing protein n=1 Tax=Riccia fluitans TaxID=41844 RepID=A0ABD1XH62_9MARC
MGKTVRSNLVFALNGERVELKDVDPQTLLLNYIRDETDYKRTKRGCGEGDCGSCVVMLSKYDPESKEVEEFTINSCLAPVCSVDGCTVTTTEGFKHGKEPHPVHTRLAGFHGSQCGFCTPDISHELSLATIRRLSRDSVEYCLKMTQRKRKDEKSDPDWTLQEYVKIENGVSFANAGTSGFTTEVVKHPAPLSQSNVSPPGVSTSSLTPASEALVSGINDNTPGNLSNPASRVELNQVARLSSIPVASLGCKPSGHTYYKCGMEVSFAAGGRCCGDALERHGL